MESDPSVEYLPENDSVRFASDRGGESVHTVRDWETWARVQCASAAWDPAIGYVREALGVAAGGGIGGSLGDGRVSVTTRTTVGPDGTVTQDAAVGFDRLVANTPRSVRATYVLDGLESSVETPVYARPLVLWLE